MLDSEKVATQRMDWIAAYDWASRLAQREPRNASLVLSEGTALHNVAWGLKRADQHFTARTSLDRLALDLRAMALMDSAARLAQSPEVWASARTWQAQLYEIMGLPTDALDIYYDTGQRVPSNAKLRVRGRYVLSLLENPVAAETAPAPVAPRR